MSRKRTLPPVPPQLAFVVRTLEAENGSHAVVGSGAHPLCCDCEPRLNGDPT